MFLDTYENEDELVLKAVAGLKPGAKGWVYANCPFCLLNGRETNKRKLAYSTVSGYYQCHRPSCGRKGFARPDGWERTPAEKSEKVTEKQPLPDEYISLAPSSPGWKNPLCAPALKYLAKRGVTRECIEEAQLGTCTSGKYRACIIMPQIVHGEVVGFAARAIVGKRFLNVPGLNRNNMLNIDALWIPTDVPLALVEGQYDHLPHWPHCVPFLGKPTPEQFRVCLTATRPLVCLLDADAQSECEALLFRFRLHAADGEGPPSVSYPLMPPGTDPGELSHDQFLELTGIGQFL